MPSLHSDPRGWAGSMVKTWPRLVLMATLHIAFIWFAVYMAADSGLRSGLIASLYIALMQVFLLYALRRLYFDGQSKGVGSNAV